MLKILAFDRAPTAVNVVRSIGNAEGFQYLTVRVDDPVGIVRRHVQGGDAREVREGVVIAYVLDPDGNIVKLVAGA